MSLGPKDVHRQHVCGATLITLRDATYPLVRFTIALRQGALGESDKERGALAMLLPLLLRGTTRRSRHAFNATLEALGTSVDAVVSHELAYLTGTALRDELPATMALLGEALSAPKLLPSELRALCEEAAQSLVSERDDDDAVAEFFLRKALYGDHPLATPAIGNLASLQALSEQTVRQRWERLAADDFVISFVGDITPEQSAHHVQVLLRDLQPTGDAHAPLVLPQWPKRPTLWVVDKPERTQVQLRVAVGGVPPKHPELDAFWLGVLSFGGTFTSPLTREVRDIRGWSYFASADFRRRSILPSPVVLRSAPALGDAVPCLALKVEMLKQLSDGILEQESLALARDYLLGRVPFQTATAFDLAGPALMLEFLGLEAEQLWDLPKRLDSLDLSTVPQVMHRHLANKQPTCVLVGPDASLRASVEKTFSHFDIKKVAYDEGVALAQSQGASA